MREKLSKIWRLTRSEETDFYYEEVHEKYLPKNLQFNEAYRVNEKNRLEAHQQLIETAVMMDYLLFLKPEQLAEAAKPTTLGETGIEVIENEHLAAVKAEERIKEIKPWSEIDETVTQE